MVLACLLFKTDQYYSNDILCWGLQTWQFSYVNIHPYQLIVNTWKTTFKATKVIYKVQENKIPHFSTESKITNPIQHESLHLTSCIGCCSSGPNKYLQGGWNVVSWNMEWGLDQTRAWFLYPIEKWRLLDQLPTTMSCKSNCMPWKATRWWM